MLPNQTGGVITYGFAERGFVDSAWNPAWYPAGTSSTGFARRFAADTWICDVPDPRRTLFPFDDSRIALEDLVLRHGSRRRLDEQLPILREMLNASFAQLGYYTEISAASWPRRPTGWPTCSTRTCCCGWRRRASRSRSSSRCPTSPSSSCASGGDLGPPQQLRLLLTRRRYRRDAVLVIKGTVPGEQGNGYLTLLSRELHRNLRAGGYRTLRSTFVERDNPASAAQYRRDGRPPVARLHVLRDGDDWVDEFREPEAACSARPERPQHPAVDAARTPTTSTSAGTRRVRCRSPTRPGGTCSSALGAFVETCLIAAADAGLPVRAHIAIDEADLRVARIVAADTPYRTPFSAAAVERRGCARGDYAPGRLAPETVAQLAEHGGDLRQLPCDRLAAPLTEADRRLFGDPAAARELRHWLRLSPRHPRYTSDGLTDRALGLSRVESIALAAALSPATYGVARRLGMPAVLAAGSRNLLRYDGSVLVLVGRADGAEVVEQGRVLLRVWLALSERGLAVHPLSQILDCATTSRTLGALLQLTPDESPLAVFRTGRPLRKPARSARIAA